MKSLKLFFVSTMLIISFSAFSQPQANNDALVEPSHQLNVDQEDELRTEKDEALWKNILSEASKGKKIKLIEKYKTQQFKRHIDEANETLEFILWQSKKYKRYLRNFPDGQFAEEARSKIEKRSSRVDRIFNSLGNAAETAIDYKQSKSNPGNRTANLNNSQSFNSKYYIKNMGNSAYKGAYLQANNQVGFSKNRNAIGCKWEIIQQTGGKVHIKNKDLGQYLRFMVRGNKIGFAADTNAPGCTWEIVKTSNNQVQLKGIGLSNKIIYLRLTAKGKLIPSSSSNFSGCKWMLE